MSNLATLKPFKKGQSGNPKGKKVGTRDFKTIYRDALIKLGQLNDKDPSELETEMISNGVKLARGGNYAFYKDTLDRVHGSAINNTDITSAGKPLGKPLYAGKSRKL